LVGPPGIGKTSLALGVGPDLLPDFDDGVYMVELAALSDPEMVAPAIAKTLGISERPLEPARAPLEAFLRSKKLLLVLDNFEHVVEAGTMLNELLAACPWIKALVTSREALHVRGERQFPVPPLEIPQWARLQPDLPLEAQFSLPEVARPTELLRYSAVAMFTEAAQRVEPDFDLSQENAQAVAQLCGQLDGLPLAIELAAARVKLFAPGTILQSLGHNLEVLSSGVGVRDLPSRQQTLRSAIGWSYGLLDPGEQTLFRRLGVFRGGATLVAVEAVCNPKGDLGVDVSVGLRSLLDKSLLTQVEGGPDVRFGLLETIREYALERLEERGEAEETRRNHVEYYLAMAEAARLAWYGQGKATGHVLLEKDHNNLRVALRWALDHNELELALRLSRALPRFWYECGHLIEGRQWLEESLTREKVSPESVPLAVLAAARSDREMFILAQSDLASAEVLITESLPMYEALDDKVSLAIAHSNLGAIAAEREEYLLALQHFEQSLAIWREVGKPANVAVILANMGYLAIHMGNYSRAIALCEESLQIQRELKETWGAVAALIKLGLALLHNEEHDRAVPSLKEGLSVAREGQDKRHMAQALNYLGLVALEEHNYSQATLYYRESLALYRNLSNTFGIVRTLTGLAGLAATQGDMALAARLLGAADSLAAGGASMKLTPLELGVRQRTAQIAHGQLGEIHYNQAQAEGQAMPVEEVVALALEE
jgi:predicted ATPase